jgi:hypothetical protein
VYGTPQWSGNLAANWYMGIGRVHAFYDAAAEFGYLGPIPNPQQKGDMPAIEAALKKNRGMEGFVRLGADVVIFNNAPHASLVEANQDEKGRAFLRAVNLPVEMVLSAYEKFGQGREISEAEAHALARERL